MGNRQRVSRSERWERMFLELVKFKEANGHCNIPKTWPENPRLVYWVQSQRKLFRKGKLDQYRYRRLNKIGFVFLALDTRWNEMLSQLIEYRNKHRHCNVPEGYQITPKLAKWVVVQRKRYRQGQLSKERIQQLQEIGFVWRRHQTAWIEMYEKLLRYKEALGDCNVPVEWKVDSKLGRWVMTQRRRKRLGSLAADRIRRLDEIGFRWEK